MNDAALIEAIITNPDNDDLRLIYADWLEENGQVERAEFIRVQVELAKLYKWAETQFMVLPESSTGQRIEALRRRERELLNAPFQSGLFYNHQAWARFVTETIDYYFTRGFVERIECSFADWLTHSPSILRATPLRVVRSTDRPLLEVRDCPESGMRQIRLVGRETWHYLIEATENKPTAQWIAEREWPRIKFFMPETRTIRPTSDWTYTTGQWRQFQRME